MAESESSVSGANDTGPTVKATPTATVEAIGAGLIDQKPPVSEHAIAQREADAAEAVGKDKDGNAFNPEIHATDGAGNPRLKANGAYALRRGRKSTASQSPQKPTVTKGVVIPGTVPARDAKEQESRAAGVGAANMMFVLLQAVGGSEWSPRVDTNTGLDEKAMMEHAHADAFAAWGVSDIPPGWALVFAYAMFAVPRFRMPQTQTRLQKLRGWMGAKIGRWKASRVARKRGFPETDIEEADRHAREKFKKERDAHG